jgi:hypothetical protein
MSVRLDVMMLAIARSHGSTLHRIAPPTLSTKIHLRRDDHRRREHRDATPCPNDSPHPGRVNLMASVLL